jgi:hypothetical protein
MNRRAAKSRLDSALLRTWLESRGLFKATTKPRPAEPADPSVASFHMLPVEYLVGKNCGSLGGSR